MGRRGVTISAHAFTRYRERVADLPITEIARQLGTPAIRTAIQFGAPYVRLGTGQRIVIQGGVIVTILPAKHRHGKSSSLAHNGGRDAV